MTTYDQVVNAAKRLVTDDTRDTWGLADAVLAHIPAWKDGDHASGLDASLTDLAAKMRDDGVTTPVGEAYTPKSLDHLRNTAMYWPHNERHPEAAYRTHQEAGSPNTEGGRVLKALAAVARGESPRKPNGLDADAWAEACDRIQKRKRGFLVAANDVRVAMGRKQNVPGRPVTQADVKAAVDTGDVTPAEVLEAVPEEAVVEEYHKQKTRKLKERIEERDADVPDAAEIDEALDGLGEALDGMTETSDAIEQEVLGGPVAQFAAQVEHAALTELLFAKRLGIRDQREADRIRVHHTTARHALDLVDMILSGTEADVTAEIEAFLRDNDAEEADNEG